MNARGTEADRQIARSIIAESSRLAGLSDQQLELEYHASARISTAMMSSEQAVSHVRAHNLLAAEYQRRTARQRLFLKDDVDGRHLSDTNVRQAEHG